MPRVKANGIEINYQERGQGDPLILIMGLGADGPVWEEHVKAFEKQFRCILMDNRGAGESDKPDGPYTTVMMADDTAGLMDALGIEKARVAGISMGGAIAQCLALQHPTKVQSIAMVSTWARCNVYTKWVFDNLAKMRSVASAVDFVELLQLWIFVPAHIEKNRRELIEAQEQTANYPLLMPQHAFEAQCAACSSHDTLDRLGDIKVPTLITVGDADIFTPISYSETINERLERSELIVFPGLGHAHHWEDLERFNSTLLSFFEKH